MDGPMVFARWRQCAFTCGQIGATWRIPLNFASFGPPGSTTKKASRSVKPFLHSSRQKVPILYNGRPFPPKLSLTVEDLDSVKLIIPLVHPNQQPNGLSIGSAVFAQMTVECPIFYNGTPLLPQKLSLPMGDLDPI